MRWGRPVGASWRTAAVTAAALAVALAGASGATGADAVRKPSAESPPVSSDGGSSSDPSDEATGYLDAVADGNQATAWTLCYPAVGATLRTGRIDWGDESTDDVGDGEPDLVHTYAYGGAYTITLTCRDSAGHAFTDDVAVLVEGPAAPAAPEAGGSVDAGKAVPLARRTRTSGCTPGPRPDRRCSPGAYASKLTKTVICSPSFRAAGVEKVPAALRSEVAAAYGLRGHAQAAAIVHVVPVTLGGANDVGNLFARRAVPRGAARARSELVSELRRAVCSGAVSLRTAQRRLARDWKV